MSLVEEDRDTIKNTEFTEEKLLNYIELACEKATKNVIQRLEKSSKEEFELQAKIQNENIGFEREKLRMQQEMHRESIKSEERKYNIDHYLKFIAAIVAVISIFQYFYSELHQENANNKRAANQYKIDLIREDIKEKKDILKSASKSISNLRNVNADIIRRCTYGHPYSQEKQDELRWKARQKIVDAFAVIPIVFGQDVVSHGRYIIQYDFNIKDVCVYKENIDNKILELQKEAFSKINKSIEKDINTISRIR